MTLINSSDEWKEYESREYDLSGEDIEYINNKLKDKIALKVYSNKRYGLSSKGYVGVVKLPSGTCIRIKPKIDKIELFEIIKYVLDIELDFYDQEIELEKGDFPDLLANLFINKCNKVFNEGLYKSYIIQRENLNWVKGKIVLPTNIKMNLFNRQKTFCEFDELSYNIIENQVPLYACYVLLHLDLLEDIKSKVYETLQLFMSENVELQKIESYRIDLIQLNKQNEYYKDLIRTSKLIIDSIFTDSISMGTSRAYSFLIDMELLFEKLIEKLAIDIFIGFDVIPQYRMSSIIEKIDGPTRDVKIIPDIVVSKNGCVYLVIDSKYKDPVGLDRCDYYQAFVYSLSNDSNTLLLCPEDRIDVKSTYKNAKNNTLIWIRSLNLAYTNKNLTYIQSLKNQMLDKLKDLGI